MIVAGSIVAHPIELIALTILLEPIGGQVIGDAEVVNINRKQQMTKKPKLELYPILKVEFYEFGKIVPEKSHWAVRKPDGTEIQCKSYKAAQAAQQALSSKNDSLDKETKL